ncbi:hypothetical protein [Pseudoalteromonas tunicata]|uniref:Uncharacterized protein n=1 Tax=Pseudoalteromonas tunicata D2 TaxID=87626 RepID=A4CDJ4_9GAMM|nr:hypothetical protein [Pseudoalteromonas tunicata]ATC96473.1 hypothetical protein PTUN_a4281 [Pseudoalteromonas tunicata]AXT31954.1 hypothetical protein D1819_14740 [Pseudoalteromonas tunicata]EAR27036.1 hypothetical protein PTD2_05180 [Pseudoalteromonas tunicata D2]MDP4985434.1 hypothetical protein [Pseudoalteromonas tunicata]MDP5212368.1 hypothetical protein [Pseudoalteromonas tunicata]
MSVIFHRIKEGEFIRLAQAHGINDIFIQESQITPNKYHLLGINTQTKIGYVVRHGRTDSMREWRLDILAALIKRLGFTCFNVRMNPDYTD